ncbi:glycoside hydrolase superfamily [Mycena vulgaris]|nr:glycoside hydrolase superfamily [Mycena vulgaris]
MNRKVLSLHDLITVGETPFTHSAAELAKYVLPTNKELNMKLSEFKETVTRWQRFERDAGFWNAVFIENHNQAGSVSRWSNDSDEWRTIPAKMLAMLEGTLGWTQYVFQGEELGLKNFPREWGIEEYKDVPCQNWYHEILVERQREWGKKDVDMTDVMDGLSKKARDHGRVPMRNTSAHAGFTTGTPWMRVNDDYKTWNATAQIDDDQSVHAFWKRALKLRKDHKVLIYGDFTLLSPENEEVFAYTRPYKNWRALVLLNFTARNVSFALPVNAELSKHRFVFGNYPGNSSHRPAVEVELKGYERRVYVSTRII